VIPQLVVLPPPLLLVLLPLLLPPLLLLVPPHWVLQKFVVQLATLLSSVTAVAEAELAQLFWQVVVVHERMQFKRLMQLASLEHVVSSEQQFCVLHCAQTAVL
jgi:hypothetical protein